MTSLLCLPDEMFRHIMGYAGLRGASNLAATCHIIHSFLDTDSINKNVCQGALSYHCYPDDDEGVRIARYIDVCYRYVVKHAADTTSTLTYCHIKNIFTKFDYNEVDEQHQFVKASSTGELLLRQKILELPMTRDLMYRATAVQVMRALIALFKFNMWTLNRTVPTKLQKLFLTDLTTPYDDIPSYYFK